MIRVQEDYVQVLFEEKPTVFVCLGTDTLRFAPLTDEVRDKIQVGDAAAEGEDITEMITLDLPTIDITFKNINSLDVVIEGLNKLKEKLLLKQTVEN